MVCPASPRDETVGTTAPRCDPSSAAAAHGFEALAGWRRWAVTRVHSVVSTAAANRCHGDLPNGGTTRVLRIVGRIGTRTDDPLEAGRRQGHIVTCLQGDRSIQTRRVEVDLVVL